MFMKTSKPLIRQSIDPTLDMINLRAGDPDFNQSEFINNAVYEVMRDGFTHYSFAGEPVLMR
jgi:aspartate/methionine/tyrosine aminotransferase